MNIERVVEALKSDPLLFSLAEQHLSVARTADTGPNGSSSAFRDDESVFATLAKMTPAAYDRARRSEAKRLGIGVTALDAEVKLRRRVDSSTANSGSGRAPVLCDPEPWPDAVDGAGVIHELKDAFDRHLTLPDGASTLLAVWTVFAHSHDAFPVSPVLAITSPEKGCGKSSLLMLLGALVRKPLPTANITASPLFRAVEQFSPTVLVDEADTFISQSDELRGILNSGWLRSQAYVVRSVPVGDDFEARIFSTWSPKVIALIGKLPDTLADRSIEIRMRRQLPEEEKRVVKLRPDRLSEFEPLRRRVFRLAGEWQAPLRSAEPELPEGFANRLADNWRPLLAIAELAGSEWATKARDAARLLSAKRDDASLREMLLADLKRLFEDEETDRLASAAIVERLTEAEDRPWPEYSHGKPLTKRGLAKMLGKFSIAPKTIKLPDGRTAKGYSLEDFEDAFSRYVGARET